MRPPARLVQILRSGAAAGGTAALTFSGAALTFSGAPVTFVPA
jgi:hypothetical protein